jgi:diguanylate cyclase (GGDEF)-like protein
LKLGELQTLPERVLSLRQVLPVIVALACLEELCAVVPRLQTAGMSYLPEILVPLLGIVGCCWRARLMTGEASRRIRMQWLLLAAGLASWTCGMILAGWEEEIQHLPFEIASLADFAYFFYGVPILFALSTPVDGPQSSLFRWLDGIQAIFAGFLAYVTIFSVLPFSSHHAEPISSSLIVLTYNIENAVLALCCLLRLLASQIDTQQWRFYRLLSIFLVTYAIGDAIYNQSAIANNGLTTLNLVVDAPFLFLTASIFTMPLTLPHRSIDGVEARPIQPAARRSSSLALFIDNVSPVLFTLALLALGMNILRQHFRLGMAAIGLALAVYAIRTTLLQVRYRQAQQDLREARDRLETLSLQDALTGIANRRSFDRSLEAEWSRATRTTQPLSLLMIDLDHFKLINDRFGHPFGDQCLVEVAHALRSVASRSGDLVARYGGEEFAVILPVTSLSAAKSLAEKMRLMVLDLRFSNPIENELHISISIGVAQSDYPESGSPARLVEASDRALYRAKQLGRNRVESSTIDSMP